MDVCVWERESLSCVCVYIHVTYTNLEAMNGGQCILLLIWHTCILLLIWYIYTNLEVMEVFMSLVHTKTNTYYSVKRDLLQCQKRPTRYGSLYVSRTHQDKHTQAHIHAYMCMYRHGHPVHTYIYVHISPPRRTHGQSIHTYIQAYIHTYMHTYRHTSIHTYIHTYIHT
jgi:hypothetical protein